MKNDLNQDLKSILYENGASLVGFANLKSIVHNDMLFGVSIIIAIPSEIVESIHEGPNTEYYKEYHKLNKQLNSLATIGANYLKDKGYKSFAQTTDVVKEYDVYRTELPHKTVATRAGLGWIGKSGLLVTEQFGSAIRISSFITDAELEYSNPIDSSKCGDCMVCAKACPANAISGKNWSVKIDRDEFIDVLSCRKKARELSTSRINKEITLCGKCFEVCPYTQRYLNSVR